MPRTPVEDRQGEMRPATATNSLAATLHSIMSEHEQFSQRMAEQIRRIQEGHRSSSTPSLRIHSSREGSMQPFSTVPRREEAAPSPRTPVEWWGLNATGATPESYHHRTETVNPLPWWLQAAGSSLRPSIDVVENSANRQCHPGMSLPAVLLPSPIARAQSDLTFETERMTFAEFIERHYVPLGDRPKPLRF